MTPARIIPIPRPPSLSEPRDIPRYLRDRAEENRVRAELAIDLQARQSFLLVADDYERRAVRAERTLRGLS